MNSYVTKPTKRTTTADEYVTNDVRRAITDTGYVSGTAQHREMGGYVSAPTAHRRAA
jgi:hypothetical protein